MAVPGEGLDLALEPLDLGGEGGEGAAFADLGENLYFINVTAGGYGLTVQDGVDDLLYLTALLNSQVLDWYLKQVSTNFHGGYFAEKKQFIEQLPNSASGRFGCVEAGPEPAGKQGKRDRWSLSASCWCVDRS